MNKEQIKKFLPDNETMLAMISHDLKTPINASIMAITLLNNRKLSPLNSYQKEILDNVLGSMQYSKTLIEDILDRYKFDNNTYFLNRTNVNFINFVKSILENSKYIFSDKNQRVSLITEITNPIIKLDALEIARVINNLISNSSKYAPENSNIKIRIFDNKQYIFFSIENAGKCAINPFKIFDKFTTSNSNIKTVSTGLGLYIVKRIINAHGGDVFAETDKNTRVTFFLPK